MRFSSSVAAGALILNQVARAQTCVAPERPPGGDGCCAPVEDYEGCGSCEDPTLRLLTTVESSSSTSTSLKYTNCGREPFPGTQFTLEDINSDITTLRGTLADCTTNNTDVSVVSFPCITDVPSLDVEFDEPNVFPGLEKIRFANLVTVGTLRVRTISFFGFLVLICFILQQYRSLTNHSQQHNKHSYQTTTNNNNRSVPCPL